MTTDDGTFEYLIKTENPDPMVEKDGSIRKPLEGKKLEKRLETIQRNNVEAGILRWWEDVDAEIRNRQALLRKQPQQPAKGKDKREPSRDDSYLPVRDF